MTKFSKFDMKMFDAARRVALQSDFDCFHVGCVVVYKKHIISSACNTNKTNPTQKKYNRKYRKFNHDKKGILDKAHAEIKSLSQIPYPIEQNLNWRDVSVYIYRICEGKPLGMGLARPCPACMAALRDKGVRKIYYSGDDSFIYEELY